MKLIPKLSQEKFLILDIVQGQTNALYLSVDRDRNLTLEKFESGIDLKKFLTSIVQRTLRASWEGTHVFKSHRRIIVSADSAFATTMPIPLEFSRGPAMRDRRLTSFELEEAVSHAMVKIVPQCRMEAAERFKEDDINVVLVGAKAQHFVIDGKHTVRPVGFVGERISLVLELTFAVREVFDEFKDFFSSPEPFFFEESAQACLAAAARVHPMPINLIAFRDDGRSGVSVFDAPKESWPVLYREAFSWPFEDALKQLMEGFSVSREAALDMYTMYCREQVSADAARGLRPYIQPSADAFFAETERAKLKGETFIDAPYPVPFKLPLQKGKTTYEEFPIKEVLEKVGLRISSNSITLPSHTFFRHLAPFVEMYFERNHSSYNEGIRRKLHWLAH